MADKYYNYGKENDVQNDKYPYSNYLIVETASNGIYFVDAAAQTTWLKTTDEGVTVSTVFNSGITISACWYDRTNEYIYFYGIQGGSLTSEYIDLADDSENAYGSDALTDHEAHDIFDKGGTIKVARSNSNAGDIEIWIGENITWDTVNMGALGVRTREMSQLVIISDDGWFLWKWSDENIELWKWDDSAGTFTEMEDAGANTDFPDDRNLWGISYNGSDILYFILKDTSDNKNYLYSYVISTDTLTKGPQFDISLMLDRNTNSSNDPPFSLEKAFDISTPKIYQIPISKNGTVNQISDLTNTAILADGNIVAITDTYLFIKRDSNDIELWKYKDMIAQKHITKFEVIHTKEGIPYGSIIYRTDKITLKKKMFVQLIGSLSANGTTVNSSVIGEGIIGNYGTKTLDVAVWTNQAKESKEHKPSGSLSGRTDENIQSIINTGVTNGDLKYIRVGTLSSGQSMANTTLAGDKAFSKLLDNYKDMDQFTYYYNTQGSLDYNDGTTDSGADLKYNGQSFKNRIWNVKDQFPNKGTNKVQVTGAINTSTGSPYTGSATAQTDINTNGLVVIKISDGLLNSNSLCNAKAISILTRESTDYKRVTFDYQANQSGNNVGFIQPGQTIGVQYSGDPTIALTQMLVDGIVYDGVRSQGTIMASEGLIFVYGTDEQRLPQENSQRIEQNATTIASKPDAFPIGSILMFSGSWTDNSTIVGWYKCDGNNGTVNLVDKFVRGATTSGGTGGSDDAVLVSHTHTLTVTDIDATIFSAAGSDFMANDESDTPDVVADVIISTEGVSGTDKNIPAYHALIYIQRIS